MGSGVQDDDWIGEPASGIYDEDETDEEDEDMELIGADEAMDQDLESNLSLPRICTRMSTRMSRMMTRKSAL